VAGFALLVLLAVFIFRNSGLVPRGDTTPIAPIEPADITAYWAGPVAGQLAPVKFDSTGKNPHQRGKSFDRQIEDGVLETIVDAYNSSYVDSWSYKTPPELVLILDLRDGRRIVAQTSPTQDQESRHMELTIQPEKDSTEAPQTIRATSAQMGSALAVLLAFQQGLATPAK